MAALMDSLDIDKAVIGGWSRGGAVAASFYHSYAARTLGLILEDGGSFSFGKNVDRMTDQELQAKSAWADDESGIFKRSWPTEFEAFYDLIKDDPAPGPTDARYGFGLLARLSQEGDQKWMLCRGLNRWLKEDSSANLINVSRRPSSSPLFQWSTVVLVPKVIFRKLDVPMLILDPASDNDEFLATEETRELQQTFPGLVAHQMCENTHHAAHLERPAWFVRDATAFLENVKQHKCR
jgi:pimeloyl-ACP methyl ester carboxylesterase